MRYYIDSENSTQLHITGRREANHIGTVRIFQNGQIVDEAYYKFMDFETYFFSWSPNCKFELEIENLEVSYIYRFSPYTVLEQGVEFLELNDGIQIYGKENLTERFVQKYRNTYHFSPYKGWMNDPNGLCWFGGYFHLFYQYNPNDQEWGNMHWGHAVSRDLLHWIHQPITSYPQIELNGCDGYRGGAFSGSAVIDEDKIKLFFTRHFGKTDRSWQRQWQVWKESCDGVHFSHEQCSIWGTPEGVDWHFRDPKVIKIEERWNMILAGSYFNRPAVFRYESKDLKQWSYKGILYQENDPSYGIAECPDFFFLDGKYVLIVSYIYADGRNDARDVCWYTGTWENHIFLVEKKGLVDIGKDYYAPQSFEHQGKRISFGWNCSGSKMHIKEPGGSNGSLSLPRVLSLEEGCLKAEVIPQIKKLFDEFIEPGPYWTRLERQGDEIFEEIDLILAYSEQSALHLWVKRENVSLKLERIQTANRENILNADIPFSWEYQGHELINDMEIYVDRALVEIYFNGGKEICSKRFYISDVCLKPVFQIKNRWKTEIKRVKSVW